jgi:hypothetical protein
LHFLHPLKNRTECVCDVGSKPGIPPKDFLRHDTRGCSGRNAPRACIRILAWLSKRKGFGNTLETFFGLGMIGAKDHL